MPLTTLPLDSNGHLFIRKDKLDVYLVDDEEPLIVLGGTPYCLYCDEKVELTVRDGSVQTEEPCRYADGITTVITLEVPSGKMVVRDNLSPVYDFDVDSQVRASYYSALGKAQAIEALAAIGCAYGPVGNSCPGLYRTGPDRYIIAGSALDEDGDAVDLPGEVCLTTVCTDVWAYSIADHDHWRSRGGDPARQRVAVVEVPPGTYRFTHHSGERGFDQHSEERVIFAHVERIA
ncbi:hypothetical protein ACFXPX_36685 [Kitasatospora sp. NPDC059146]|uniref:hypothetical protein n=1 Tax=unclassified Kitasatospora TaxID=2633591 RepID=UPI0036C99F93